MLPGNKCSQALFKCIVTKPIREAEMNFNIEDDAPSVTQITDAAALFERKSIARIPLRYYILATCVFIVIAGLAYLFSLFHSDDGLLFSVWSMLFISAFWFAGGALKWGDLMTGNLLAVVCSGSAFYSLIFIYSISVNTSWTSVLVGSSIVLANCAAGLLWWRRDVLEHTLQSFDSIVPSDSPELLKWCLEFEPIAAYQRQVVAHDRTLVRGEFEAIRDWVNSLPVREAQTKRQRREQAAFDKLKTPIMKPGL